MSASWFTITQERIEYIFTLLKGVFDTKADSSHTHTKSDITDFPSLGTAAAKDVPSSGNATSSQVVMGNDSRLSDSRTPKSHTHTKSDITDFAHDHPLSIESASTATSAINLDPNAIYKLTAGGKTFIFKTPADNDHYAWADITGKPSSFTPSAHTHTVSQITDFPSTMPPSSHAHGNIQNGGTLQTNDVAIANGDKVVITDSSDSSKIARASIAFDGSTATKCLTQKGTWESFTNNAGTVTQVKVGTTAYNPSSGVVSLPAYPTTLPASDVYSWAKASTKPSYTLDEVSDGSTRKLANYLPLATASGIGSKGGEGTHNVILLATIKVTGQYSDGPIVFEVSQRDRPFCIIQISVSKNAINYFYTNGQGAVYYAYKKDETTFEIYANINYIWGAISLHRITGYRYNNSTSVTVNLTKADSIPSGSVEAVSYGNVNYATTAGSAPASDVYSWAKASTKPSYTASEVGAAASNHTHTSILDNGNSSVITFAASKSGLNYGDYTWLAAWNGYELRAVNKNQFAQASHTHGNIQNGGTLQTNDITIASGDKLVVTDSSDSSKIARASISFDGSTATKCLTQKGTWESFTNNAGTVISVEVGDTSYAPSNGVVSLPAYPTNTDSSVLQSQNDTSTSSFSVLLSSTLTTSDFTGSTYKSKNLKFSPKNADLCIYGANSKLVFEVWCQGADTTTSSREVIVKVGNDTAKGTSGNRYGILRLYSQQTYKADIITAGTYTANRTFTLPDKTGTIALTSDITADTRPSTTAEPIACNTSSAYPYVAVRVPPGATAGKVVSIARLGINDVTYNQNLVMSTAGTGAKLAYFVLNASDCGTWNGIAYINWTY